MSLTQITVSYSVGMKVGLKNYSSIDTHESETATLDVAGLTDTAVDLLRTNTYNQLKERVDERLKVTLADVKKTFNV